MLTERQAMILKYIVDNYSKTGVPVGSKVLAEQLPIHVSSATIRNEMAVLSHKNFIEKLHTSSGRIPSIQGYRYYIDNLTRPIALDEKHLHYISEMLDGSFQQVDDIIRHSAEVLSHLTDYTALTFRPELPIENTVQHLQFVNIGFNRIMAVIVMGNEQVESQSFLFNRKYTDSQLTQATNFLNSKIVGKGVREVKQLLNSQHISGLREYLPDANQFVRAILSILNKIDDDHYFVSGQINMFEQNRKQDFSQIKPIYSMFSNENGIRSLLEKNGQPISVKIGPEIDNDWLKDYSIITGTYDLGDHGIGRIALIGPTRMSYPNMLGLVDAFRHELKNRISGYYRSYDQ